MSALLLTQLLELSSRTFTAWTTAKREGQDDLATYLHALGDQVSKAVGICIKAQRCADVMS